MLLRVILDNIKLEKYTNKVKFPTRDILGDERASMTMKYNNEETRLYNLFISDIKELIHKHFNYTDKQMMILINNAWQSGHASGLEEVVYDLEELLELIDDFIKVK